MGNLKNNNGITLVALTITILLFTMILSTITFASLSSVHVKQLNNMYADITNLQEKIDMYYLKYGTLPVKSSNKVEDDLSQLAWLNEKNVNDNDVYYKLDSETYEKIGGITLNNSEDEFYINEDSHTIYYGKGVQVSDDEGKKYTIDLSKYTEVKLEDYQ